MRGFLQIVLIAACGLTTGCAAMHAGRDVAEGTMDMMKPRSHDYRDDANYGEKYNDEWTGVGREGRAHMPLEHESDALTPLLESPKARAINRSLGYD
ncbi:MAG: hypothetical protein ACT4QC_22010 [Planctomycetaceae bacterium]